MHSLIDRVFKKAFNDPALETAHDGADLPAPRGRIAMTTDSYVVHPLFFPGSDIGALAVNGTVNDLAMCGAKPLYMTASFILEEGLALDTLEKVAASMAATAKSAGIRVVTGDTKVVERGKGDGVFICTSGVGEITHELAINPSSVKPGDAVLLSGDIGRHGMAVMGVRESLGFSSSLQSDCACLWPAVEALLKAGIPVHCLRDLTRGGLATSLVEISGTGKVRISISEESIPVGEEVRGACEVLGLDPLYVANEGRFAAFVPAKDAERALATLRATGPGAGACIIGAVEAGEGVVMKSTIGASRPIDMLSGEQLPRIC
jgi:hydrogenase expression/formation protein HypE